jgi:hypothetical protein
MVKAILPSPEKSAEKWRAATSRRYSRTWQGLYLWEHRTAPRTRSVVVTVMGEGPGRR